MFIHQLLKTRVACKITMFHFEVWSGCFQGYLKALLTNEVVLKVYRYISAASVSLLYQVVISEVKLYTDRMD